VQLSCLWATDDQGGAMCKMLMVVSWLMFLFAASNKIVCCFFVLNETYVPEQCM